MPPSEPLELPELLLPLEPLLEASGLPPLEEPFEGPPATPPDPPDPELEGWFDAPLSRCPVAPELLEPGEEPEALPLLLPDDPTFAATDPLPVLDPIGPPELSPEDTPLLVEDPFAQWRPNSQTSPSSGTHDRLNTRHLRMSAQTTISELKASSARILIRLQVLGNPMKLATRRFFGLKAAYF